jgi:hypothetical protein
MPLDDWHLTEDVDDFLAQAGDFLRSRPALHTTPLSVTEKLRTLGAAAYGAGVPSSAGWSERARSTPPSTASRPAA